MKNRSTGYPGPWSVPPQTDFPPTPRHMYWPGADSIFHPVGQNFLEKCFHISLADRFSSDTGSGPDYYISRSVVIHVSDADLISALLLKYQPLHA